MTELNNSVPLIVVGTDIQKLPNHRARLILRFSNGTAMHFDGTIEQCTAEIARLNSLPRNYIQ